jgi:hypothetical protein
VPVTTPDFFPELFLVLRSKYSGSVSISSREPHYFFYPVLSSLIPELHSIQTEKLTASWKSLWERRKGQEKKVNGRIIRNNYKAVKLRVIKVIKQNILQNNFYVNKENLIIYFCATFII